jgi:hypothetical protein
LSSRAPHLPQRVKRRYTWRHGVHLILGAIAAVALVTNLVNIPALLCVALALWIAGCLYFSLLDRTPRSYVLMLAGFTAPFVGFPLVDGRLDFRLRGLARRGDRIGNHTGCARRSVLPSAA